MKKIIGSALIGTGLAAAALSLAATANAESAAITIGQLEAQGFDVKLDRVGSAPLNQCEVTGVRNPRERTELVRVGGARRPRFHPGRREADHHGVPRLLTLTYLTISELVDNKPITCGAAPAGLSRAVATLREDESEMDGV